MHSQVDLSSCLGITEESSDEEEEEDEDEDEDGKSSDHYSYFWEILKALNRPRERDADGEKSDSFLTVLSMI